MSSSNNSTKVKGADGKKSKPPRPAKVAHDMERRNGQESGKVTDDSKQVLSSSSKQSPSTSTSSAQGPPPQEPDQSESKPAPLPHRILAKPRKGILKPPPPPPKPGLSGKLRDALGAIHPKFLDMASPTGSVGGEQVAAAARGIAASPVANLATGVFEGAGVLGGAVGEAAAAVVGTWGGKLGKLVNNPPIATSGPTDASGTSSTPKPVMNLPWKLQTQHAPASTGSSSHQVEEQHQASQLTNGTVTQRANPLTALSATIGSVATSSPSPLDTRKPLKKASFLLPMMSITYFFSSNNAPYSDKVLADRDTIERTKEEEVRALTSQGYWTADKIVRLYELASNSRDEKVRIGIRDALSVSICDQLCIPHVS